MPDRLVDHVVDAVPAPHGLEALDPQLGEQRAVEALDLIGAVQRVARWLVACAERLGTS